MTSTAAIQRRYLILLALRWLPVGFISPLLVLILTRNLTLSEAGPLLAVYGMTTAVLELPTGGLADAIGRRPVLLVSSVFSVGLLATLIAFDSFWALAAGMFMGGVARALDSGPLESWFVDRSRAIDPGLDLRDGLARGGVVDGLALALGAIIGGYLPELFAGRLVVSVWVAVGFQALHFGFVLMLMSEDRRSRAGTGRAPGTTIRTITDAMRLANRSSALRRLLVSGATIGVALVAIETLWQPQFIALLEASSFAGFGGRGSGGTTFLGLLLASAFAGAAAGSAFAPRFSRFAEQRLSPQMVGQGLSALALGGLALATLTPLASALFISFYFLTGMVAPLRHDMLHEEVSEEHRSTMLSAESLVFQTGGFLAALTLPLLADREGIPMAWLVAAGVVMAGSLLYPHRRRHAEPNSGQSQPS